VIVPILLSPEFGVSEASTLPFDNRTASAARAAVPPNKPRLGLATRPQQRWFRRVLPSLLRAEPSTLI